MNQHSKRDVQEAMMIPSLLMPDVTKQLEGLMQLVIVILGWLSVGLEVFIRRDFGERYLSWIRLYLAYSLMGALLLGSGLIEALFADSTGETESKTSYFWVVFLLFVLLSFLHRLRITWRNKKDIQWHTMSFGVSWLARLLPFLDDWALYRYVEPFLWLIVGYFVAKVDTFTGTWLILASLALLIKNHMVYGEQRGRFLDIMDAQIEAAYMNSALHGTSKKQTAGFSVVPVPKNALPAIEEAMENMDIASTVQTTMSSIFHADDKQNMAAS